MQRNKTKAEKEEVDEDELYEENFILNDKGELNKSLNLKKRKSSNIIKK